MVNTYGVEGKPVTPVDEFSLIRLLTGDKQTNAFRHEDGVEVGIGDDAAVVHVNPGIQWVLTCDTMTEEIHFKPITMRDADIGFKAMGSAVSDIAAMGGRPRFALVALCLPKDSDVERVRRIYDGLYDCADRYGIAIVGGDTTSSAGGITISVTVIGEVKTGRALLRSSARPGDAVFVTGFLGRSAAGLEWLLRQNTPSVQWGANFPPDIYAKLVAAHCRPLPQIEAGLALSQSGMCHALNDVSDGLSSEAWEIAEASGVGIDLIEEQIPIADELRDYAASVGRDPLEYVMGGGEDYELLGTVPAAQAEALRLKLAEAGLTLQLIGHVTDEHTGVRLVGNAGEISELAKKGYNHFVEG
ncbi:thiamine-monophosphate kinase [Paenibacillus sp. UNCCL117]|uniref:thiamine-phosphate kinase n=1 Tax=unclassified Paenibacillus TaxID=185978 RepID=UPI00088C7D5B|nr:MULTISPECIES: thiamine-phosphate kinase [unclassified Paenibacillus]SDE30895.1 thiamine-monophosphate kinase [Paenibacillus sp. cl123]SFW63001.1 thiamine-monophosphate kinase [Paenibacillus sp. UNCCL117]